MESEELRLNLIIEAVQKFPDDVEAEFDFVITRWRKHPLYESWLGSLADAQVRREIFECRHNLNRATRSWGDSAQAKVTPGAAANGVAVMSILNLNMGGKRLGEYLGKELEPLAVIQENTGNRFLRNALLVRALKHLTKDEKTVRQCVSDEKALEIYQSFSASYFSLSPKNNKTNADPSAEFYRDSEAEGGAERSARNGKANPIVAKSGPLPRRSAKSKAGAA